MPLNPSPEAGHEEAAPPLRYQSLRIFPLLLLLGGGILLYPPAVLGLPGLAISVCLFSALCFYVRERFCSGEAEREFLRAQVEEARVNYRALFENVAQGIFQSTPEGHFTAANPALARLFGLETVESLFGETDSRAGRHFFADPEKWAELLLRLKEEESVAGFEAEAVCNDGRTIWISENVHAVRGEDGEIAWLEGTIADVTARRWAERRRALQVAAARILSECISVAEARPQILGSICEILEWEIGAVWDVAVAENRLQCVEVWHGHGINADAFERAAAEKPVEPGAGLAGRAWQSGEPTWVVNFTAPEGSASAVAASRYGMNSAFAVPIKVGGTVARVLEFFSPRACGPDAELLQTLAAIASQIGHLLERKQAEEALRDTVVRKTAILESALDPVITFDREGRVIEWNAAAERTFGLRRAEVLGRPLAELILPPEARTGPGGSLSLYAAAAGFGRRSQISVMRAGGEVFPAEIAIARAMVQGRMIYTAYLRDLTEAKRAGHLQQWVEALLSASGEAVFTTTPEGVLETWSAGAERLFGYTAKEAGRKTLEALYPAGFHEDAAAELDALRHGEISRQPNALRTRKNGAPVSLHWAGAPIRGERGGVAGMLFAVREATGEEAPQGVRPQSQKMEALGRLAGGVAHDFNNILTAILGYADLLLSQIEPDSPAQESATEICKAGRLASSITRHLLSFSRGQSEEVRLLDAGKVVSGMAPMLRRLIGETIRLEIQPAAGAAFIKADAGELEQVILNLALNARDAIPSGEGSVTIRTARRAFEREDPALGVPAGKWVELSVKDTGLGMSESVKRQLFEPFFTTKRRGRGTGLGLATAYGIIRHAGGHIACESAMGSGTLFRIFLPLVEAGELPGLADEEPGDAPRGTERILLLEDEESVRRIAGEILKHLGYTVETASDAGHARALLSSGERFDLLLADVVGAGGKEVALWIRENGLGIPVLLVSGCLEEAVFGGEPEGPFAAYLQKPFTPTGLARKVREALHVA